jgi:hypothetical protein
LDGRRVAAAHGELGEDNARRRGGHRSRGAAPADGGQRRNDTRQVLGFDRHCHRRAHEQCDADQVLELLLPLCGTKRSHGGGSVC